MSFWLANDLNRWVFNIIVYLTNAMV